MERRIREMADEDTRRRQKTGKQIKELEMRLVEAESNLQYERKRADSAEKQLWKAILCI